MKKLNHTKKVKILVRKIELFHFWDCGQFDELNLFYIFGKENIPEILFLIANTDPFKFEILKKLYCSIEQCIEWRFC